MFFNLGSINLDHVYQVPHFPQSGETLTALAYACFAGGKGLNQSVAAARAGALVRHIGACGADAEFCLELLRQAGADTSLIDNRHAVSGHALIYVDPLGENQIVLNPAANRQIDWTQIEHALADAKVGDTLILQNETNHVVQAARLAHSQGMRVAYSAAPFDADQVAEILGHVDLIAVNRDEAALVSASLQRDVEQWGVQALVTLGGDGARFYDGTQWHVQPAMPTEVVDTTGAGDTFFGFFIAHLHSGPQQALRLAAQAAALQVSRPGAALAIPTLQELA